MTLKERIQVDKTSALKTGDKKLYTFLGVLIGELDRKHKDPKDDEVIREVKTMIENAHICGNDYESSVLKNYLPQQLSSEQLTSIISTVISENNYNGMKDMGKIMKILSDNYTGQYDGSVASSLVKQLLIK